MARLIRTEKEVEGRYEEVWLVVEEDALDQWPAGRARSSAGRRRASTASSARAARRSTPPTSSCPGCCTPPCCARPYAHARVTRIDLAPALALPGVHAAIGPGDIPQLEDECGYQGAAVAAVCADTFAQARAARRRDRRRVGGARAAARPRRGGRARQLHRRAARARARRLRARGSPRPTSSSKASTARRSSCTTRWRRTSRSCSGSATRSRSTSRRSTSGASATRSRRASGCPPDKVRVVCHYMGGGFGSKNGADDYTFIAVELAKRDAPAGAAARSRAARRTSPPATATRRSSG